MKRILFINGSPNRNGQTATMAKLLLAGKEYETLNLIDYKIYPLGQSFKDDQLDEVLQQMLRADVLVMGSPVYWHSMTGQFRTLLDRIYDSPLKHRLKGKALYFIFLGAGPSSAMLEAGNYTMRIFCRLFQLQYRGMATSIREAETLGANL
nr:flavodoxin family protein [Barnesiella viscericola]